MIAMTHWKDCIVLYRVMANGREGEGEGCWTLKRQFRGACGTKPRERAVDFGGGQMLKLCELCGPTFSENSPHGSTQRCGSRNMCDSTPHMVLS